MQGLAQRRTAPRVAVILATVGLTTVGLAACGSSGSKSSAQAAGSAASTASTVKATGGGDFCKSAATQFNKAQAMISQNATDPAHLRDAVRQGRQASSSLQSEAPAQIKGDLNLLVQTANKVYDALAKANYDFTKLSPSDLQGIGDPNVTAANQRVSAYVKKSCGFDLSSGTGSSSDTTPATSTQSSPSSGATDSTSTSAP